MKTVKGWLQLARPPVGALKWEKVEFNESIKLAIESLEKQVPMRPVLKLHTNRVPEEQKEYYCPTCDEWLTWNGTEPKHCEECGQAIDWS